MKDQVPDVYQAFKPVAALVVSHWRSGKTRRMLRQPKAVLTPIQFVDFYAHEQARMKT